MLNIIIFEKFCIKWVMKTILFLHGWGGDENSFAPIISDLGAEYNCLALSMPMFRADDENNPARPWTLENYAYYIEKFLGDNKVTKCHIVAHSFGARVAAIIVSRNPSRFDRLVLTGPAGIRVRRKFKTLIKIAMHKVRKFLFGVGGRWGVPESAGSPDYRVLSHDGKQTFNNILMRTIVRELPMVTRPALLIFGSGDTATPPKLAKIWQRLLPVSQVLIYDGAGHFAYLEERERFVRDVAVFLGAEY